MKTLSFRKALIGRTRSQALLELDTASDGARLAPGLNLIAAPNGKGKTTLLQSIGGMLPLVEGQVLSDEAALDPSRDVLYVSEYLTFPKFVYPSEWVEFMSGRTWKSGLESELSAWVDDFALRPKLASYLGRMSQGERRKVTWLGAHATPKSVLLLDEPLDGLDLLAIKTARRMIQAWRDSRRTVVIVAHQLSEILDLSDEVFLIRDKKLIPWSSTQGGPAAAVSSEKFAQKLLEFYS